MAQDHLRELIQEKRRNVDALAVEHCRVRGFQIGRREQPIAKPQPDLVIVAGVGILDRRDFRLVYRLPWLGEQAPVKRAFR